MSLVQEGGNKTPTEKQIREQIDALNISKQNFEGWTKPQPYPTSGIVPSVQHKDGPYTFVKQS